MRKDKEEEKSYKKAYYEANKAKILEKRKEYREENKDLLEENRKNNLDKINEQRRIYITQRKINDPLFRLSSNIRKSIAGSIKRSGFKKITVTEQILGCSFDDFKTYLENQFEDWMNWDNYGNPKDNIYELNKTWDIDHKIPTSAATTESELIALNHYTNLQPLCSYNNRFIKRDN
jgi:hypothetical protein